MLRRSHRLQIHIFEALKGWCICRKQRQSGHWHRSSLRVLIVGADESLSTSIMEMPCDSPLESIRSRISSSSVVLEA